LIKIQRSKQDPKNREFHRSQQMLFPLQRAIQKLRDSCDDFIKSSLLNEDWGS
jgi:hypothetical protein